MCIMKKFIKVQAIFDCDGNLMPELIIWDNKQRFSIERVTDIRYTDNPGAEEPELRFTCVILGREKYVYYSKSRWYVDAKSSRQELSGASYTILN